MENKKNKMPFRVVKFNKAYEQPENKINNSRGWIEWGKKNNYPIKTFELYNYTGSATHKAIINRKNALISGNGFNDITDIRLKQLVINNKLEQEIKKISLDHEIIRGYAIRVVWNNEGTDFTTIDHMPIHKLREGIKTDDVPYPHFWFSNDWANYTKAENNPVPIREFNPLIRQGEQVFVYYQYNPLCEYYSIESYSNSMNWIELDYEISKFHLNQIKQGYAPSFMINFATGVPTEDEMDDVISDFQRKYQGAEGAGKALVTFSEGSEQAPNMQSFDLNDSDDRFLMLKDQIKEEIVIGHDIPPQLIILTPGKLGSSEERTELQKEFQDAYVTPQQRVIESGINYVLSAAGYKEKLTLAEYGMEEAEIVDETETDGK